MNLSQTDANAEDSPVLYLQITKQWSLPDSNARVSNTGKEQTFSITLGESCSCRLLFCCRIWVRPEFGSSNTWNVSVTLFLLLGDNVYIDHPERPAVQKYCYYRRQSRPEYKRFTSGTRWL